MVLMEINPVRARVRQSAVIREEGGLSILRFHAMGTVCRVSLAEPSRSAANAYLDQLLNWVADFEAKYSRFLDDSIISRINAAAGKEWVEVDAETDQLLSLCGEMSFFTRGAFDPTALPLIRLWNWKANPPIVPDDKTIQKAKELVSWGNVQRRKGAVFLSRPGMCLDFGGIGKEYAADRAAETLWLAGVTHGFVDLGGDIRAIGPRPDGTPWRIGIQHPRVRGAMLGSIELTDAGIATSGDYERYFERDGRRFSHLLDPRTGWPAQYWQCVSASGPVCVAAGACATVAMLMPPAEARAFLERQGMAFLAVTATGEMVSRPPPPAQVPGN
jgi:FAD:protein FMN transferase